MTSNARRKFTRKEAVALLEARQNFDVVADEPTIVMDGDGKDVCEVKKHFGQITGDPEDLAALIAFVLQDYPDACEEER